MSAHRGLAAAATTALLLTGCGVTPQPSPELVPGDRLPAATAPPAAQAEQVRVWVVRGERVVPVFVDGRGSGLRPRLEALLAISPSDDTLLSALPAGSRLLRIVRQGTNAVELQMDGRLLQLERPEQPLAVAQLVLTATEQEDVTAVRITSDGRPLSVPGPSGRTLTRPLSRADLVAYVQGPLD